MEVFAILFSKFGWQIFSRFKSVYIHTFVTYRLRYEEFGTRNVYPGHGYVVISPKKIWDVITYCCPRYLLLVPKSSFVSALQLCIGQLGHPLFKQYLVFSIESQIGNQTQIKKKYLLHLGYNVNTISHENAETFSWNKIFIFKWKYCILIVTEGVWFSIYRGYPAKRALPCLRMADRVLLAGYPQYAEDKMCVMLQLCDIVGSRCIPSVTETLEWQRNHPCTC